MAVATSTATTPAAAATPKVITVPTFRAQVASERVIAEHWDNSEKDMNVAQGWLRIRSIMYVSEGILKASWAALASIVTTLFFRNCRYEYYNAVKVQIKSALWCAKAVISPKWAFSKASLLYTHRVRVPGKYWGEKDPGEKRFTHGQYHESKYGTTYDPARNTWRTKCGVTGNVWFTSKV